MKEKRTGARPDRGGASARLYAAPLTMASHAVAVVMMGIAAVKIRLRLETRGFGLSEALAAGDVWKGSWKFETDRSDQPYVSYYWYGHA